MNELSSLIQKYHARTEYAEAEARKIKSQITLANHEAEKYLKKAEDMKKLAQKWENEQKKIYFPDWKADIVDKLAKLLADKTGLRWAVHGPGGIGCRCYVLLYEDAEKRPIEQNHKVLVVRPEFDGEDICIFYETGEVTDRYEKGTLGYASGLCNKVEKLPDDLDAILSLFKEYDAI